MVRQEDIEAYRERLNNGTYCRVYWGSHGCKYERGHEGDHICACCECNEHPEQDEEGAWCAGAPPYYTTIDLETMFFGADYRGQPRDGRASGEGSGGTAEVQDAPG